ncbi:MAG: hypothetical protein FJY11_04525, partial [Bacteroidetes bacterium]|nr:hypothetical protein [Bacteroidota bacterium]
MKAKYSIWLIAAAISTATVAGTGAGVPQTYITGQGNTVVNNYYMDDFGYHYSSRISRFHRSYSAFDYYSPVYTESYWYNFEPYTWGLTIYSGGGFGIRYGYSWSYPAFYGYGWHTPAFYSSYSWGYDPFYHSYYMPVVINIKVRNYYPGYRTRYYSHYHYGNNIRVINTYNNHYYYGNNPVSTYNSSRFNYPSSPYPSANNATVSRRSVSSTVSNTGAAPSRRETITTVPTGNSAGQVNTGRSQTITSGDQAGRRSSAGTISNSGTGRSTAVNPPAQNRSQ